MSTAEQQTTGTSTTQAPPPARPDAARPSRARKSRARPPRNWRETFLSVMSMTANVSDACQLAGVDRRSAYRHREADPDFAEAWEQAIEKAVDSLEREAWRRATVGTDKPVFNKGQQVGVVTEYSDRLLMFLLAGARPEKYRENFDARRRVLANAEADPEGPPPAERVAAALDELAARRADRVAEQ